MVSFALTYKVAAIFTQNLFDGACVVCHYADTSSLRSDTNIS